MEQFASPAVPTRKNESSSNDPVNDESADDLLHELDKLSLSSGVNSKTIAKKLGELMKSAISIAIKRKDDEKDNSAESEKKADFSQPDLDTIEKIDELAKASDVNLFAIYFGRSIVHLLCTDLSSQQFHKLVQLMIRLGKEDIFKIQNFEQDTAVYLAIKRNIMLLPETIDALANKCRVDFSRKNNQGDNLLHLASKKQAFAMLQRIVKYYRGDLNAKNKGGNTALHNAARQGNLEILQYLVSLEGVDVNVKNDLNETPLVHLFYAPVDNFMANLNVLVNAGADINAVDSRGRCLLFHAVFNGKSSEVAQELVRLGCRWQHTDNRKQNILHICAKKDNFDLLSYFVGLGANVNDKEIGLGRSALHVAALKRNTNAFEYLISHGGDVNLKDSYGNTPLSIIIKNKDSNMFVKIILMLTKYGKQIDGRINNIEQLLILVAQNRMSSEEIQKFVDLVVDLSLVNEKGRSLLHSMTTVGNVELVKYLISKGIDVNKKDFQGRTPLHLCVASEDEVNLNVVDFDVVDALIAHGAEINATDNFGLNVLLLAAKSGKEWKDLERLFNLGASCNATDCFGDSILHILAKEGNVNALKFFISSGVNVNAVNVLRETPLHSAKDAKRNFIETVIVLTECGVLVEAVDFAGQNALHRAMIAGRSPNELSALQYFY